MEIRLHTAIPNSVNPQLKHQISTLNLHMQLEIQVVELDAFRGREPCEQALRDGVEIGGKCANVDQSLVVRIGRCIAIAADEIVFND